MIQAAPDNAAIAGYSMCSYGALIFGGPGLSQTTIARTEHAALVDPRIKAVVAVAPWGRQHKFWDAEGLDDLDKPPLLAAGSDYDVLLDDAIREIFDQATGTTRHLLTFDHANTNAAAPTPAPAEAWASSETLGRALLDHYSDAVWDNVRMNKILQHFTTAFLHLHLKGSLNALGFLDLVPDARDGIWSVDEAGSPDATHSYWTGVQTAVPRD